MNEKIDENINCNQFGGMGGASTTDALVEMIHRWSEATDELDHYVRVALLDFIQAFDLINHNTLLVKLRGGGCWSKNYFAHFSTQPFHCTFIMISMKKYGEKIPNFFFPQLVSMEMAAIFDFRALTKVHLTSKPLLQMQ